MTFTTWAVTIDPIYLAAFVALSFGAAFALGAFIRRAQGPRADVNALAATVDGVTQERLCAKALCMDGAYPRRSAAWLGDAKAFHARQQERAAREWASECAAQGPSPHVDGEERS